MRGEHFAERLVPRGAQAAELHALVIVVEAQLALAVVEERASPVGIHGAQIERQVPVCAPCAFARASANSRRDGVRASVVP